MGEKRKRRFFALLLALVMVIGQMAGTPGLTVRAEENTEGGNEESLGNIALGIEFGNGSEYRQKNNYTWLFLGESMTLSLDDTEFQGDISEYVLVWEYGRVVENVYTPYGATDTIPFSKTEDGSSVTINAGEQVGTATYSVQAYLYEAADDYTSGGADALLTAGIYFDIVAGGYDYWYPTGDGISQLPEWDYGIDKYFTCYVDNAQNPYGSEVPTEITAITVVNGQDETSADPVVTVNAREDNSGWDLHMDRMGHAVGTITYQLADGGNNTATHTFNIWVSDSVYGIDASTDTGVWQLLPGDSIEVTPTVWLDCYNEEKGYFQGNIDNVILTWAYGTNDANYAEAFDVSKSGNILTITAKEGSAERDLKLELRAYVPNENDGTDEVVYGEWWINSWERYQRMEITSTVNTVLGIGQQTTVNTALWDYCVDYTSTERKTAITEGYQLRWEWDTEAIQITDANNKVLTNEDSTGTAPFTVKKLKNWGTSADLIFELQNEEGDYYEVQRKNWNFEELNYDVWFNGLRGEDYSWTYVSADNTSGEEYDGILLYRGNLDARADRTCTVEWILGIWDEAQEETIPLELGDIQDIYTIRWAEDGDKIILRAEKLKRAIVEQFGDEYGLSMDDNLWVHVETKVRVGEGELRQQVAGCGTNIEIRKEVYDYQFPIEDGKGMLPNWSCDINKYFDCSVENADNPDGGNVPVEITNITVANAEDEETTEAVVTCTTWKDGNGWNINANTYGHAVATITYKLVDGSGETATRSFDIWVCDCIGNVDASSNTNEYQLIPGEELNLTPTAWFDHYSEENGQWREDPENVTFQWKYGENGEYGENGADYAERFEVKEENGKLYVKALKDSEGKSLQVQLRAFQKDENGELQEIAYGEWWIRSHGAYHAITTTNAVDCELAVGATCTIIPSLYLHQLENETPKVTKVTENPRYRVEWDTDAVKVTDAAGKELKEGSDTGTAPFTIKKLKNWGTEVSIAAELEVSHGKYDEVARRSWYLNEQDYGISYKDLRGGDYTWMFASDTDSAENEDYTIELNMDNLEKKPAYTIEWQVGMYQEDEFVALTDTTGAYEVSEDGSGITLQAEVLKAKLVKQFGLNLQENENVWFEIATKVYAGGEEVAGYGTGIEICAPEYHIDGEAEGDMVIGTTWSYPERTLGCYVRNKDYPQGEYLELPITNITASNLPQCEDLSKVIEIEEPSQDNDNQWVIRGLNYGGSKITYSISHKVLGEREFTIEELWVSDDIYRIDVFKNPDTDNMLPGATLELATQVWHIYRNDDDKLFWAYMDEPYEISYINYSEDMITVDENGTVTAGDAYGGAYLEVKLSVPHGEDDPYERYEGINLNIIDCYYYLETEGIILEPGDRKEIPAVLKRVDEEHPQGIVIEDAVIHVETEDSDNIGTEETGTFITAIGNGVTNGALTCDATVIAEWKDEDNNNKIREERSVEILICRHKYKNKVVAPTYAAKGYTLHTCDFCGYSYTTYTDKLTLAAVKFSSEFTPSTSSVKLSWSKNAKATGYKLYQYNSSTKKYECIKTITSNKTTNYTVKNLKAGTTYYFKIRAYVTDGRNYYSDYSAKKTVTTVPDKMKLKTSYTASTSSIKLSWTRDSKATGYKLYQYNSSKKTYKLIATIKSNKTTSYTVKNLKAGTNYYFSIKAYKTLDGTKYYSSYSDKLKTATKPSKVTISSVSSPATKKIKVSWKKVTGASGYQVQIATSDKFSSSSKYTKSYTTASTSKTISSLTKGKKYYVRVRAYKKVNNEKQYGSWSAVKNKTSK